MEGTDSDHERISIVSSTKKDFIAKIILLTVGGILVILFFWALLEGRYSDFDENTFLHVCFTLGFGSLLLVATLWGGFQRQSLTVDRKGIRYAHWPAKKRIEWADLKKVRVLGVNHPEESAYAMVFETDGMSINVASDFDRKDLKRVVFYLERWRKSFGFDIEDTE